MRQVAEGGFTKWDIVCLLVVTAAATLIHGWIGLYAYSTFSFTDSMDYMFMADFYRTAIYGGDLDAVRTFYRNTRFPPLFPALLGSFGAGTENQHLTTGISNLIAVLAVAVLWIWTRREFNSRVCASAVALGLLLLPYNFLVNLSAVSEPLAILMVTAAFALLAGPHLSAKRIVVVGLIVGMAPLARGALLPLPIAFAIWLILARSISFKQMCLPLIAAFLPFLLWLLYRDLIQSEQYAVHLSAEQFHAADIHWPSAIWTQPQRLFAAFVVTWASPLTPIIAATCTAIVTVFAVVGCHIRLRRNAIDAWFLVGYIFLILIWPFPTEFSRFIVVVYPCILVSCISAVITIDQSLRRAKPHFAGWFLFGTIALASAPAIYIFLQRAALPVEPELVAEKRELGFFLAKSDSDALLAAEHVARVKYLLLQAESLIPKDGCVYATPPQLASLYSKRIALAYPSDLGEDNDAASLALQSCEYYFVGGWAAPAYGLEAYYPSKALQKWTKPILVSRMGGQEEGNVAAALLQRAKPEAPREDPNRAETALGRAADFVSPSDRLPP